MGYGDGGGGSRGGPKISNIGGGGGGQSAEDAEQEAAERNLIRRCVDYHGPATIDLQDRLFRKACRSHHVRERPYMQDHSSYIRFLAMPISQASFFTPSDFYLTYCAHVTRAKNSTPIICLSWTPGGRRLLTGNSEGQFTLWDGINFSFELLMTAHEEGSFRSMAWSHNNNYLLTCDTAGIIKYWSPSIAPVKELSSHNGQAIHALSFSPSDTKFVSCGDDSMVRIWDWASHAEERVLKDHGWDVKSVDWHPRSSVIASGSKDNVVKLWDPRVGTCLSTLYGHKNTVTKVAWNPNGNWLVTASRDQLIKLYDIRAMKEMQSMKGHEKEVSSVAWHPLCQNVLASGGMDGTLIFWNVGGSASDEPAAKVPFAHDMAIWDMQWHPAGHMLATGSNDRQTKFWARNRPGSSESRGSSASNSTKDGGAPGANKDEILKDEIELKNHVGIVIGRKGQTIISMQRSTGTKMHVDQLNRTLLIEGTATQIATVRKRVGALLERVSNEDNRRNDGPMI